MFNKKTYNTPASLVIDKCVTVLESCDTVAQAKVAIDYVENAHIYVNKTTRYRSEYENILCDLWHSCHSYKVGNTAINRLKLNDFDASAPVTVTVHQVYGTLGIYIQAGKDA